MQRGLTIEQGTNNVLNNCDDDADITPLPPAVVKGIQDVMALFMSQDSFVEQCKKHNNNDEMISDAAVSVELQGRINATKEAAKAEHRVLTKKEKRKICTLYLELLQQDCRSLEWSSKANLGSQDHACFVSDPSGSRLFFGCWDRDPGTFWGLGS